MKLDPFILSRIQFALNITFHIIFPLIDSPRWIFFFKAHQQTGNRSWLDNYFSSPRYLPELFLALLVHYCLLNLEQTGLFYENVWLLPSTISV